MLKLNKTDEEILEILKVVFLSKKVNPMLSDNHMELGIIRSLFAVSVFSILTRIVIGHVPAEISAILNSPVVLFFGFLFLHINNKLENTSLILFVLTWLSILIVLYV